jgi:hypothetical protein
MMLQHNRPQAPQRAHFAHAAVVGVHVLCCGLPALALLVASLSGAAAGSVLLAGAVGEVHRLVHAYEVWIVAGSAALVGVGAWLELSARRAHAGQGFPWLFGFSVLCFLVNLGVVLVHRGG